MEVLAQETFIENSSINIEFLNRAGKITLGRVLYLLLKLWVIVNRQIGTGALLIINNYILGLFEGNQCFYIWNT